MRVGAYLFFAILLSALILAAPQANAASPATSHSELQASIAIKAGYRYCGYCGYARCYDPCSHYYGCGRCEGYIERPSYSCRYWSRRCAENWGYGNEDYYGCLRYHGCD